MGSSWGPQGPGVDTSCLPEWDGIICWPKGSPSQEVSVPCPSYIYDFNHKGHAYRYCSPYGTWAMALSINKTWANYTECALLFSSESRSHEKVNFFLFLNIVRVLASKLWETNTGKRDPRQQYRQVLAAAKPRPSPGLAHFMPVWLRWLLLERRGSSL
ncbi:parathyroid hormone parathyroid hormone-related peptide receptor-like [Limosa lapponica baueri]|uniref:Parathyroid hormone parathyroid hormone-related peptide receptor-like n=1 Tax=Limosa lapponica baueri TaxID=1758121 RepID=A0A2I0T1V4_LIMLA|nr:parathyroid hormone parathyroid hormone-related peptide receptor-like [Limosa lapponica baueri]